MHEAITHRHLLAALLGRGLGIWRFLCFMLHFLLVNDVLERGQSSISLSKEVDFELLLAVGLRHQEKHPDADIEFIAFKQQWLFDVLLYNVGLRFDAFAVHSNADLKRSFAEKLPQLLQRGEDVNPTSSVERGWFQYPQFLTRWLFGGHALALLHYPGKLLTGIPDLHEVVLDYEGLEFADDCPLEVVAQKMRQTFLNLRCILPKIHQIGDGHVLADGIGVGPLEVAVQPILVGQFNLSLQVVENDSFAALLACIEQPFLDQTASAVPARTLLHFRLQPAHIGVLPVDCLVPAGLLHQDLTQNGTIVAASEEDGGHPMVLLRPLRLRFLFGLLPPLQQRGVGLPLRSRSFALGQSLLRHAGSHHGQSGRRQSRKMGCVEERKNAHRFVEKGSLSVLPPYFGDRFAPVDFLLRQGGLAGEQVGVRVGRRCVLNRVGARLLAEQPLLVPRLHLQIYERP